MHRLSKWQHAETVSRRITVETHEFYQDRVRPSLLELATRLGRPELGPSGYEVLFGPPHVHADVLFIGFQPGGDQDLGDCAQPAEREPMWPSECQYAVADWRLAKRLQSIFTPIFLKGCTGSEVQFFRAKNYQAYGFWPDDLRRETEQFSLSRLALIIEAIEPKRIVMIGKQPMLFLMPKHEAVGQSDLGHFLIAKGECMGISAMACAHLSGRRLTVGEMSRITAALIGFVETPLKCNGLSKADIH